MNRDFAGKHVLGFSVVFCHRIGLLVTRGLVHQWIVTARYSAIGSWTRLLGACFRERLLNAAAREVAMTSSTRWRHRPACARPMTSAYLTCVEIRQLATRTPSSCLCCAYWQVLIGIHSINQHRHTRRHQYSHAVVCFLHICLYCKTIVEYCLNASQVV